MPVKSKSAPVEPTAETMLAAYVQHILQEGKEPQSVFRFCTDQGISEDQFYRLFSGFPAMETAFWKHQFDQVAKLLSESPEFKGYAVREKIAAFFFTWIEQARSNRSFVLLRARDWMKPLNRDPGKAALEEKVKSWMADRIREGMETGEIQHRPIVDSGYNRLLSLQFFFVFDFWIRDQSPDFEDTDALIEKSMQVVFDLLQQNTLDKTVDLARFLWSRMTR
jgi:hypothetical protein